MRDRCKYCNRFLSKKKIRSQNKYCNAVCFYKSRIKKIQKRFCLICGIELSRESNLKGQKTCSKRCAGRYFSQMVKEGKIITSMMKIKLPKKICKRCGKPLRKRQIILNQQFCSVKCRALDDRILKPRICPICQKPLTYKQLQKKQIHCSAKCQATASGLYLKGRYIGPRSFNWQGGISFEPYDQAFNDELKDLIRKRDGYKCQLCKAPQIEFSKKLSVHHIDYNKKNSDPINLIALCVGCNSRVNKDRKFWQRFFTEYQKERLKAGKMQLNSKKKEKGGEKICQHHFQATCNEGKRKLSWQLDMKSIDFRQSHQKSGETPGLHQGNPNVKARAILRDASPAETEMMEDDILLDKSMSSIIRRASSNEKMKR